MATAALRGQSNRLPSQRRIKAGRPTWRLAFVRLAVTTATVLLSGQLALAQHTGDETLSDLVSATGFSGITLIHQLSTGQQFIGTAHHGIQVTPDTAVLPASTFKIFSTMAALQTGVVAGPDEMLAWDGVTRGRSETNRDMTLREAFALSSVPHYQQLVSKIGPQRMQSLLDDAGYGNQDMSGGLTTFWLSGGLRMTPAQQIDLLRRLYHDELPFRQDVMSDTKDIMQMEANQDYRLFAKTGLATPDSGSAVGWWVGWVERDSDTWFFATLLLSDAADDAFIPARIEVTRRALQELGALP